MIDASGVLLLCARRPFRKSACSHAPFKIQCQYPSSVVADDASRNSLWWKECNKRARLVIKSRTHSYLLLVLSAAGGFAHHFLLEHLGIFQFLLELLVLAFYRAPDCDRWSGGRLLMLMLMLMVWSTRDGHLAYLALPATKTYTQLEILHKFSSRGRFACSHSTGAGRGG